MRVEVIRADVGDLDRLVPLVDAYRQFYEQASDESRARRFLSDRLVNDESVILLAVDSDQPTRCLGFVQLFASFDSVDLAQVWILHDLFVAVAQRRRGVGRALMVAAKEYCRATDAVRIDLATASSNARAQRLYESLGYRRDEAFHHYSLLL